jgi:lysyl-tRNA synthetase class I
MEAAVKKIALLFVGLLSISVLAQTADVTAKPLSDDDIKLLRGNVQAEKEDIIRNTMQLSDVEAKAFWPVYKQYAQEQHVIADKRLKMITDYAQNLDKMEDAKAKNLTEQLFQIEDDTQALRKKYFPEFQKALGGKRAAKFYQVDNRLNMIVNVQLASEIPLIP